MKSYHKKITKKEKKIIRLEDMTLQAFLLFIIYLFPLVHLSKSKTIMKNGITHSIDHLLSLSWSPFYLT